VSGDADGVNGGTSGVAGAAAASNLIGGSTPFGWVALGAKLLSGTSINKSAAAADAQGGFGQFTAENKGGISSALIEFDNPVHVAIASVAVVALVYVVKKWGKVK
jgi:hypothetical protein